MLSEVHASSAKFRTERSAEMILACDVTANCAVIELFDAALNRPYSRTALYGVRITAENTAETLRRLSVTAMRSAGVPSSAVKGAAIAASVFVSNRLEEELSAADLGLDPETELVFVPYISMALSGRFTATLLTIPNGNFLVADLGANICIGEKNGETLRCAGFPLSGAFDGTALESGMPCENGAIDAVRCENGIIEYEVVGDGDSLGISPAGAVCASRIMLSEGVIDSDGIMTDRDLFAIGEDFFISQSDIRVIQSDKAKCAAAFELFGTEKPYLSGAPFSNDYGFRAMTAIGAVPEKYLKASFCGNSVIRGAENFLLSEKYREKAYEIVKNTEDISERLAEEFDGKYLEHLSFEKKIDKFC